MNKLLIAFGALVVLGVGWYALSPLFTTIVVDDALPEEAADAGVMPSGAESLPPEEQEAFNRAMAEANADGQTAMDDAMPGGTSDTENATYPVMGTLGHPASGHVRVIETAGGTIIRYEDFETINGPRLHVYLAKSLDATDFIDLGPIKGTKGNINYAVPDSVNLDKYSYVMYWCVPFGVLFNYAELR